MAENWDKPNGSKAQGRPLGSRGRGFNPAIRIKADSPVGRPARREEPKKDGGEIDHWGREEEEGESRKVDWSLAQKHDYKDVDLRRNRRRDNWDDREDEGSFSSRREGSFSSRREGSFSGRREESSYGRREESSYGRREGSFSGRREESSYGRREESSYGRREGSFSDRREESFSDRREESFSDRCEESSFGRRDESSYGRRDSTYAGRPERRGGYDRDSRFGGSRDDDIDAYRPRPSLYIPKRPTEDEDEIFGSGISSGINFDRYDDIEVRVSGEDPPKPIKNFQESGVKSILMDLIKKCNYTKPTPIQKYAIPVIMSGRDLMACAQTGSGKTAAFLIPIMNRLLDSPKAKTGIDYVCKPQALVVTPTRELTIQIFNEARKFSRGSCLRIELAYGGTAVSHQIQLLTRKGCDFLVATPGRLLDIIRRGKLVFTRLKFAVLDEADRMLDLGFLPDMEEVMEHIAGESTIDRQTLMFSATFPEEIQILAGKFLKDYLFVAVGIVGGACQDVEQKFYEVSKFEKRNKLVDLLIQLKNSKCLIFVEQKRTTDVIAAFLSEKNFRATSIHGGREQREREEALEDFKNGHMKILVATSVAARGLDIKNVANVVNYDLPKSIDEYVHRIGRTGRVGNRGSAISFYDEYEDSALAPDLVKILKQSGQKIPDFLKKYSNEPAGFDSSSKFGGRDVRHYDDDPEEFREEDDIFHGHNNKKMPQRDFRDEYREEDFKNYRGAEDW